MKKNIRTLLASSGLNPEHYDGVVNTPVHRASTILFNSLADFEAGERGDWKLPIYGRYGNASTIALEESIARLEGADHSIALASGMAAIAASLTAFLKTGDHLLMVDTAYAPTRRFCEYELKRYGVEVTYYDPVIGAGIASLIKDNTRVIYTESPGSLTFEMQDVPAIAKEAHKHDIVVISDNTWATPLHFDAFEKGVDISMHSATKYISGHSDLVMGVLSCREKHYKQLLRTVKNLGARPSADECYLALRGMRTMALRVREQLESGIKVASWLAKHPQVEKVIYPALPGDAGHALWKRDMTGGASLFAILLKPCSHDGLAAMLDGLNYFGMGFSWGGFESLIIPIDPAKIRTATKWNHPGYALRIHIGLEEPQDLIDDLEAGFERMKDCK